MITNNVEEKIIPKILSNGATGDGHLAGGRIKWEGDNLTAGVFNVENDRMTSIWRR